jgi:hypothetical protein
VIEITIFHLHFLALRTNAPVCNKNCTNFNQATSKWTHSQKKQAASVLPGGSDFMTPKAVLS